MFETNDDCCDGCCLIVVIDAMIVVIAVAIAISIARANVTIKEFRGGLPADFSAVSAKIMEH